MKKFLGSKKAKAFLTGLIILIGVHLVGLDEATANAIAEKVLAITGIYIGAQSVADIGKGKAQAEATAASKPTE